MNTHKIITIIFILLSLSQTAIFAKENTKNKETILALGMEMSNMRNMLAAYILIGANITYKNPKKRLKDGIIHYENMIEKIENNYPNDIFMQKSVQKSLKAWSIVKKSMELALQNTPLIKLKKGAIFIHGNIRTVIKEMAAMKAHLLEISDIPNKIVLNASIEIAASSKRLSAHYMMELWHLDDPSIEKHWKKGMKIYADSIEILKKSPFMHNKQFARNLQNTIKYHRYFKKMWKKSKIYSILIDKKTDIVFNKAKEMTEIILDQ